MLRYLFVHQKVLEESSQILHSALVNDVDIGFLEKELGENQMFKSLLYMELAYCYLHYKDLESAKQNFQTASQAVEFEIEWGGKHHIYFSFGRNADYTFDFQVHWANGHISNIMLFLSWL